MLSAQPVSEVGLLSSTGMCIQKFPKATLVHGQWPVHAGDRN